MKTELSKTMTTEPSVRATTLLLTFTLALFGAGACGAAPDQEQASADETNETDGEVESHEQLGLDERAVPLQEPMRVRLPAFELELAVVRKRRLDAA